MVPYPGAEIEGLIGGPLEVIEEIDVDPVYQLRGFVEHVYSRSKECIHDCHAHALPAIERVPNQKVEVPFVQRW
jgi:hypothetical protein